MDDFCFLLSVLLISDDFLRSGLLSPLFLLLACYLWLGFEPSYCTEAMISWFIFTLFSPTWSFVFRFLKLKTISDALL